jgi:hypothetical protein
MIFFNIFLIDFFISKEIAGLNGWQFQSLKATVL